MKDRKEVNELLKYFNSSKTKDIYDVLRSFYVRNKCDYTEINKEKISFIVGCSIEYLEDTLNLFEFTLIKRVSDNGIIKYKIV
ncbi:hypothetical protein [Romboutsia sp.]|uniref:hypothetical protein n=1 Tax=Romboutsia sp. TaxID=1965302 RepID=UPI002BF2CA00|nr:hypothetical protein [Romboutsia sp.]HSQ88912.1 hypothetical protein [Romboutsia sp.]